MADATAQRFAEAHQALRGDPGVQFVMGPPDPPPPPPEWLKPIGKFFEWIGHLLKPIGEFFAWITSFMPAAPVVQILLWTVIGGLVLAVIWLVITRIREGEWRLTRRRRSRGVRVIADTAEEEWIPDAAQGRAWLQEADALASQGLYAEAVHHLLFRSIEDIQHRRPQVVRPALTSRELAAATGIPGRARELFAAIARLVERSLFGGRDVSADDWATARSTYADFALPGMWKA